MKMVLKTRNTVQKIRNTPLTAEFVKHTYLRLLLKFIYGYDKRRESVFAIINVQKADSNYLLSTTCSIGLQHLRTIRSREVAVIMGLTTGAFDENCGIIVE